jgi:para-aminobenzoate synthetase/4-amino-4-deoxychorismate lyase
VVGWRSFQAFAMAAASSAAPMGLATKLTVPLGSSSRARSQLPRSGDPADTLGPDRRRAMVGGVPTGELHAILELDAAPWGPLAFGPPRQVIEANNLAEVLPALRAIDAAAHAGRWAVGYLAYQAAPALDPALPVRPGRGPLLWFGLHDAPQGLPPPGAGQARLLDLAPRTSRAEHGLSVERLRRAIAAGTAYQVNLTLQLRGRLEGEPLALYRRLRAAQGGGQTAFLRAGGRAIVSASPELFLLRTGDLVRTRPMKGTARRGRWSGEDEAAALALAASEKDRAENVMIADLLRNDLGRVAETGRVRVASLFEVERFRTVWQLTSTVEARLAPGTDLAALLAATFPCGSVTGAPKRSAMRLIAAEEPLARGVYCGAVGAVAPGGDHCFSVAIRTVEVDLASGAATYGTGGGITFASDPGAEWDEALAKAAVLDADPTVPTLLETMRLEGGRVALLDGHLARLAGSARYHGIPLDVAGARALVEAEGGAARLRLHLHPDGRPRLERAPLPAPLDGPALLAFASAPVSRHDRALFHKTTDRARYDGRRAERPDCFDVILRNEDGQPTETTIGNLVAEVGGERVTPPLEAGLLPGVFREDLLRRGEVRARPLTRGEVERAPRLWLVNALRGWVAARLVR